MMIVSIATLLLLPLLQSGKKAAVRPTGVTLCQLVAKPTDFDGQLVTFKASFESDGIERSILLDQACPNSGGLLPGVPEGTPGGDAFDDALRIGHPGTLDKTITASFTGVFHYSDNPEMCMFLAKDICRRHITITRIRNLVVTMKQKR